MPKIYGNTEILGGDLTVLGNMVISGTQTSLNVEELIVSDNIITLNGTFSGAPVLDSGIEINRGSSTNSRLIWNETTDYWVAGLSGSESAIITQSGDGLIKSNNQLEVDFGTVSSIAYVGTQVSNYLPLVGGDLTGPLTIPSNNVLNFDGASANEVGIYHDTATSSLWLYNVETGGDIILTATNGQLKYQTAFSKTYTWDNIAFTMPNKTDLLFEEGTGPIGTLIGYSISANRSWTMPDDTGTIALTSQLPTIIGTTNSIPLFTGTSDLGDSLMIQSGTGIGIGITPTEMLHISESDGNRITKLKVENGGSTLDVDGAGINLTSGNTSWDIQVLKNNTDHSFGGALQFKYGNTLRNHFDLDGNLFFDGSNQYIQLPISGWIALDGAAGATAGLWYNASDEIELYANGTASELKIATTTNEPYAFVNISSVSTQFFPISTGFRETIPTSGASGRLIYNSTTSDFNYWNGATWSNMADNFADTDLTFTGNRIHSTNNNYLEVKTAATTFERGWMIVGDSNVGTRAYSGIGYATSYIYTDVNDKTYIAANDVNRLVVASSSIVINETSENDFDFRVEGATDPNLLFVEGSTDNIGMGNNTPLYKLQVSGTVSTTGFRMTDGASDGYVLTSDTNGVASWAESSGGISGTGTTNYIPKWSSATGLTDSLASSGDTGVGIGTASADNMLTVFGDANITGDLLTHSDTITTLGGPSKGSVTWFDHDGDTIHILHNSDTSGTDGVARFMVGDFTTPANKVYGQFAYFSPTYLGGAGQTTYQNMLVMKANSGVDGMILDVDSGSGKTITILPESADVVFSESTGFSGFGTASPVEKVEVVGNIKINGQVYVDIPTTLSPSTNSQNIDWDDGNIQIIDFGSAPTGVTFSFSNQKTGGTYTIKMIQGANLTTVNWPTSIKWESGVSLIPTNVDNAIDVLTMVYDGTDYYASFGKNFS